jgi:hypothetical protein
MIVKVPIYKIGEHVPNVVDVFICTASFEARCTTIAAELSPRIRTSFIIRNREVAGESEENYSVLKNTLGEKIHEITVSLNSATETADQFKKHIIEGLQQLRGGTTFVDITTFTHEQLLIFLALLKLHPPKGRVFLGYTGAGEYSTNTNDVNVWLSRGVKTLRSVLGYPGRLAPTKKLHLMILVGFESERAQALIEIMEPAKLSLGVGRKEQSVSAAHYARNKKFYEKLEAFVSRQTQIQATVDKFDFSCIDPSEAKDDVLLHVKQYTDFNTVICPMNTKLSTVGAGLAALEEDNLQVVYAQAEEYNQAGYSTPGATATIFELFPADNSPSLISTTTPVLSGPVPVKR